MNFGEYKTKIKLESVTEKFLTDLNHKSFFQRPEYRRLKAEIDTSLNEVIILPDLLSESFSCEIKVNYIIYIIIIDCIVLKPKWSGLKHSHRINDICNCRYCLAQISKGRRLESNNSIIYCPKFLFSNEETKIFNALSDLFLNPSNQLRLFIDFSKINCLRYVLSRVFR